MIYWYLKQVRRLRQVLLVVTRFLLLEQARSSVGERHLDVVDVGGSIPPAPTRI